MNLNVSVCQVHGEVDMPYKTAEEREEFDEDLDDIDEDLDDNFDDE